MKVRSNRRGGAGAVCSWRSRLVLSLVLAAAAAGCTTDNASTPAGSGGHTAGTGGAGTGGLSGGGTSTGGASTGGSASGGQLGTGGAASGGAANLGTGGGGPGGASSATGGAAGGVGTSTTDAGTSTTDGGATDSASGSGGASAAVDPGTAGDGDFTIGPDYPKSADLTAKNVPVGKTFDFTMDSKSSKFYTGSDKTLLSSYMRNFTRAIKVYVPAKYKDGTAAPLFVIHDGPKQFDISRIALDNFSNETNPARQLPAFVIVSIANGGGDDKGSERGLEYDTMSDRYVRFVEMEVLPAVLNNAAIKAAYPHLAFTTDPEGRATMGASSGGAAAFTMAWFRTDLFRRVIAYSGTFVDQQDDDAAEEATYPLGAWDYHSGLSLIANNPAKPLRVVITTGEMDIGNAEPESGHHNWVIANQRMAAAFKAKKYHYKFIYAKNTGHAPDKLQENTLPENLLWLWRGYPTN